MIQKIAALKNLMGEHFQCMLFKLKYYPKEEVKYYILIANHPIPGILDVSVSTSATIHYLMFHF